MAAASVTLVREIYEAFARRDAAAVLARLDPDVEIRQTELVPWGGHYRGHEAGCHLRGRYLQLAIRAGDVPFDLAVVHVWTVRDARIARLEVYIDTPAMQEALASR